MMWWSQPPLFLLTHYNLNRSTIINFKLVICIIVFFFLIINVDDVFVLFICILVIYCVLSRKVNVTFTFIFLLRVCIFDIFLPIQCCIRRLHELRKMPPQTSLSIRCIHQCRMPRWFILNPNEIKASRSTMLMVMIIYRYHICCWFLIQIMNW